MITRTAPAATAAVLQGVHAAGAVRAHRAALVVRVQAGVEAGRGAAPAVLAPPGKRLVVDGGVRPSAWRRGVRRLDVDGARVGHEGAGRPEFEADDVRAR